MEAFLNAHTNSAWAPGIALTLGNVSRDRLGYSKAAEMLARAWDSTKDASDGRSLQIAHQAGRELAGILAMTGQLQVFDDLVADAKSRLGEQPVREWWWAREFAGWVRRYPDQAYKCGLACLDQLGRLTEPGSGRTATIFYRASSINGYDAAELVQIAGDVGLHVKAVRLQDLSALPVPAIAHLGIEHFVVIRQRNGLFYEVMDPVQSQTRWLTAMEIAREATGCLIVSAYSDLNGVALLTTLNATEAAGFRGRCYHGNAIDANDGCPEGCPCPNGGAAGSRAANGPVAKGGSVAGGGFAGGGAAGGGAAGGSGAGGGWCQGWCRPPLSRVRGSQSARYAKLENQRTISKCASSAESVG